MCTYYGINKNTIQYTFESENSAVLGDFFAGYRFQPGQIKVVFNFFCGLTPTFANIGGIMLKGQITLLQKMW